MEDCAQPLKLCAIELMGVHCCVVRLYIFVLKYPSQSV